MTICSVPKAIPLINKKLRSSDRLTRRQKAECCPSVTITTTAWRVQGRDICWQFSSGWPPWQQERLVLKLSTIPFRGSSQQMLVLICCPRKDRNRSQLWQKKKKKSHEYWNLGRAWDRTRDLVFRMPRSYQVRQPLRNFWKVSSTVDKIFQLQSNKWNSSSCKVYLNTRMVCMAFTRVTIISTHLIMWEVCHCSFTKLVYEQE